MAQAKSEYLIEIKIVDGQAKANIQGVTKGFESLDKALNKVKTSTVQASKATDNLGKKNLDLMNKSGLAGATLIELGRTISDLPYGIRGIANNLSQLSTLFITLTTTTNGFKNAIKVLTTTLTKGPLGYILAFQAVIAALDFFAGKTKEAKKEVEDLTLSIREQVTVNRELADSLNEINLTREEQEGIIREVTKKEKDLKDILKDVTLSQSQRNVVIQKYLVLREKEEILNEKLQVSRKRLSEANLKLGEAEKNRDNNLRNFVNLLNAYGKEEFKLSDLRDKTADQLREINKEVTGQIANWQDIANLSDLRADVTEAEENYNEALLNHIELLKESNLLDTERTKLLGESKAQVKDNADQVQKLIGLSGTFFGEFYRQSQKLNDNFAELSRQRREIELADIQLTLHQDIAALKQRSYTREEFERGKEKLIEEALKKEVKAIKFALDYDRITIKERIDLQKRLADISQELADIQSEKVLRTARGIMEQLEFVAGALNESVEAEISIEERKTVLANNELKKRLRNESLSAKQRESINNQIAANEEALQAKRDKLAEKQFNIQKAISIGQTLITTYEMASKAYGALVGIPVVGPALATAAAAVASAFGLMQVDAIRRTQFVPSGISGGGGGSGGGGAGLSVQAPDFNVVGASGQSQLAETIAGSEAQPVRAYVVGKDITTQQELDRNITNTASFG